MSAETAKNRLLKSPTIPHTLPVQPGLFVSRHATQSQAPAWPQQPQCRWPSWSRGEPNLWGTHSPIWPPLMASAHLVWACGTGPPLHPEAAQRAGGSSRPPKSPRLRLSLTHRGSGRPAWLGSAGARHISFITSNSDTSLQWLVRKRQQVPSHYLRHSFRSALRGFVTQTPKTRTADTAKCF